MGGRGKVIGTGVEEQLIDFGSYIEKIRGLPFVIEDREQIESIDRFETTGFENVGLSKLCNYQFLPSPIQQKHQEPLNRLRNKKHG